MMSHNIQCQCGSVTGEIHHTQSAMRVVCYCKDCQRYAQQFNHPENILDALGGTDIAATQANHVSITAGQQHLACMSLSEKGLLRWYAKCCDTPIANMPRNWQIPYVGIMRACLNTPQNTMDSSFPKIQMRVNTNDTPDAPHMSSWNQAATLLRFMPKMAFARLSGQYKNTPFFSSAGKPMTNVRVLAHDKTCD